MINAMTLIVKRHPFSDGDVFRSTFERVLHFSIYSVAKAPSSLSNFNTPTEGLTANFSKRAVCIINFEMLISKILLPKK